MARATSSPGYTSSLRSERGRGARSAPISSDRAFARTDGRGLPPRCGCSARDVGECGARLLDRVLPERDVLRQPRIRWVSITPDSDQAARRVDGDVRIEFGELIDAIDRLS